MKKILIASFDMEVGGVERSLLNMLDNFDYQSHIVDLMLYSHQGDFMNLVNNKVNLLEEIPEYATFRKSIVQVFEGKQYSIGVARFVSKIIADCLGKMKNIEEVGYYQMQLMWKFILPFLPKLDREYDMAISYLWPHYFIAHKIKAKKKVAWIHTDYSTIELDIKIDIKMWDEFDYIVAVSEGCKSSFLKKYSQLEHKVVVLENIISPSYIREMSNKHIDNPMNYDNRFKIVTVARLSHAKGIDNAVRALKILKDRGFDDIVWYVVGYGGDKKMIKDMVKDLRLESNFILLGKQINPYPYIKEADLYVQPSRYEGKAVTVGEAQILSKPVMITNYSTAESQVVNGFDGYITELSIEGIANGIEKLYKDPHERQRLITNCTQRDFGNSCELKKLYELIQD
ncbi:MULTISPECIES: glycosyltransferase [Bacillus]|uniref:Glycosyl transferase n=1 Tax=Bacillus cereus TaxID=1396 RepID=A0A2C1LEP8_BACCE|nr:MULTISPECIES: glycosyltransferase [Bacillus]PGT96254.1 glycosyl transferase [Bacillus cereus]PGX01837.1 glycosyl transferase [Bacillus sp. AFS033286]